MLSVNTIMPTVLSKKPIFGSREVVNLKVKAAVSCRTWHCKVGCLDKDVKSDDVKEYMRDLGVNAIAVESLRIKHGAPLSMHIEVPYGSRDVVMDGKFWPKGVYVSGWKIFNDRRHFGQYNRSNRDWEYEY